MTSLFQKLYSSAWLLACVAFAALGAPYVFRPPGGFALQNLGREGSLDSVLQKALGEKDVTARLTASLEKLPPGSLLILTASGHRQLQAAYLLEYLAWPRPVSLSQQPVDLSPKAIEFLRQRCVAIAFCDMPIPPALPAGEKFGNILTLVPLQSR